MVTTVTAADLADIRELARPFDPVASVYLGLRSAEPTPDTEEDLLLRWRALAARLAAQGADAATIGAIGRHVADQPIWPTEYAVFAVDGAVRFAQALPGGPRMDRARFGAPAELIPLLAWRQRRPPFVVVVTDRTGADITAVPRGAVTGETVTVVGPDDELDRKAPRGRSQPRHERRAEDTWQHNAGAVARAATAAIRQVGGQLLLLAGDVRAVQLLRERLPSVARRAIQVRELPGGRSPDGSAAARQAAIERALGEYADAQCADLLNRFVSEWRPGGNVVEGLPATAAALAEGRVHTLLVGDDPDDERRAWFGPDQLVGSTGVLAGRLPDVAVRAALLTDAEVCVLSREAARTLGGRIGGLCRFSPTAPVPERL
jgi:hypothetical protein